MAERDAETAECADVIRRKGDTIWHQQQDRFRLELLTFHLRLTGGNRSHAAANLGIQRTYLCRLIRHLGVQCPRAKVGRPADKE